MNSIISWVGGKKALRELIYQRMPKEFGRYIEVFGGGGWVLFGRPMDTAMEVYNDFNFDLANSDKGAVSIQKVELIEVGDQSPEAVEAFVCAAIKQIPDGTRLGLILIFIYWC
jgi:site-specific DNA-adenine methylase